VIDVQQYRQSSAASRLSTGSFTVDGEIFGLSPERRRQVDDHPHADDAPPSPPAARVNGFDIVKQQDHVRETIMSFPRR
jgi:hypothetical protein